MNWAMGGEDGPFAGWLAELAAPKNVMEQLDGTRFFYLSVLGLLRIGLTQIP